jgi:hypothetical protein
MDLGSRSSGKRETDECTRAGTFVLEPPKGLLENVLVVARECVPPGGELE